MDLELPDDGDGLALRLLIEKGVDMHSPVEFEFAIQVADEFKGQMVIERLRNSAIGGSPELIYDPGELEEGEEQTESNRELWPSWTVCVHQKMVPHYRDVVAFQDDLKAVCDHIGRPDGWNVKLP